MPETGTKSHLQPLALRQGKLTLIYGPSDLLEIRCYALECACNFTYDLNSDSVIIRVFVPIVVKSRLWIFRSI